MPICTAQYARRSKELAPKNGILELSTIILDLLVLNPTPRRTEAHIIDRSMRTKKEASIGAKQNRLAVNI